MASYSPRTAPPGYPKTTGICSAFKHARMASAPVISIQGPPSFSCLCPISLLFNGALVSEPLPFKRILVSGSRFWTKKTPHKKGRKIRGTTLFPPEGSRGTSLRTTIRVSDNGEYRPGLLESCSACLLRDQFRTVSLHGLHPPPRLCIDFLCYSFPSWAYAVKL